MARKGTFVKGDPRAGRKKGVPNKATRELKAFIKSVLDDPEVQAKTLTMARAGKLPAPLWIAFYHYEMGKPKEIVTLDGDLTFTLKDANDRLVSKLARLATSRASGLPPGA